MIPWHVSSCGTVFAKEAPISEMATSGRLKYIDHFLIRGHLWKANRYPGMVKYIKPVQVVPIAATPPGLDANGSLLL